MRASTVLRRMILSGSDTKLSHSLIDGEAARGVRIGRSRVLGKDLPRGIGRGDSLGCKDLLEAVLDAPKIRAYDKTATDALFVSDIAGRIKGARGRCKKRAWVVNVLWPDPNSEGH